MARSYQDLLANAREQVPEVQVADLAARARAGDRAARDRRPRAGRVGRGPHPRGRCTSPAASSRAASRAWRRPDQEIILAAPPATARCSAGTTLREMGYDDVASLAGGFQRWKQSGQPWDVPQTLTPERARYSRHVLIPEVGEEGQLKLLDSKALLIGAGGLGSPAAYYLAAAGVGTLGLVDDDVVDASNLQRQIIHTTDRVGMPKGESAQDRHRGAEPGRHGQRPPLPGEQGQRPRPDRRLRRDHRRRRQLPHPLPAQRRRPDDAHAAGAREHPPLRGPRVGVPALRGPLLPLPLPGAAAARPGAVVRRGRRARRALRRHGQHPGERGDQAACSASARRSPAAC